jgi:hypothetical protein
MHRGGGPSAGCEELRLKHRAPTIKALQVDAASLRALAAQLNTQRISTARARRVVGITGSALLSASAKIRLAREGHAKMDRHFRPINCPIALS